jgi:NADH-quinone oxidoreductase subunit I
LATINDLKEYWHKISHTTKTLKDGLELTFKHLKDARNSRDPLYPDNPNYFDQQNGINTIQYPKEVLPVPQNGRYKLHNEIDDCIVCDKCAKVCPVDCIDIEPVRAVDEFGKTSDGTPKRIYAAKFDIDMAKCCFCGLCTTVCPTECLTMTSEYDFSEFDVANHNFVFGEMTPLQILEKKQAFEVYQTEKEAAKKAAPSAGIKPRIPMKPKMGGPSGKPVMKPKMPMRPVVPKRQDNEDPPNSKPE